MSLIKEAVTSLHNRLKELTPGASAEQLAYLAKSIENIGGQGTLLDIVALSDEKLIELADAVATHQQDMTDAKDNHLIALEQSKDSHIMALTNSVDAQVTQIDNLAQDFQTVNDIPSGSTIMEQVNNKTLFDNAALPFLFGIISRAGDHFNSVGKFTTELGKWTDPVNTDTMFKLLTGAHDEGTQYNSFREPPGLKFFQGSDGGFVYSKLYEILSPDGKQREYPHAVLGVVFITNETGNDITSNLDFGGACRWSSQYEGAGLFLGTPNAVDGDNVSQIDWSILYVKTENVNNYNANVSVIFPANKTVALLLYNSAYNAGNSYARYSQYLHWNMKNIRSSLLAAGLSVDRNRTMRAWQCPGLSHSHQIWQ